MNTSSNKIYYVTSGSIIFGIVFTFLYIIGYFPNIVNILTITITADFLFMIFAVLSSLFRYAGDKAVNNILIPFLVGTIGSMISTELCLATYISVNAKSHILLVLLSSIFFTFAVCYFYKTLIYFFTVCNKHRH